MKRDLKIYISLVVIIIVIIIAVFMIKNQDQSDVGEESIKCIASKTLLYSSKTCGYCKRQKDILGDYYSLFNVIDCFDESQKCADAQIRVYPTWIIDGKQDSGVKTIQELKELTGC